MDPTATPAPPVPSIIPKLVNPYYRTPAQASMDAMAQYQNNLPRVSSSLKPRADGRKKFTTEQTQQMETLFRENTHPSRDQRVQLAASFDVGEKSIGIWFQNRRQALRRERKLAESNTESPVTKTTPGVSKTARTNAAASSSSTRPTLERVASEHQLPTPKARSIFNASYHPDHVPHIWGHMMSSPSPPPVSPTRSHPYPYPRSRPRSNTNPSSDIESDSQYSTSTRHSVLEGGSSVGGDSTSRSGSSPLSRTRSMSPTRLAPRLAQNTLARAHSDIGAQRTARSGARNSTRTSRAATAANNASGRVTLEWACANATRLPPSPLRASGEAVQEQQQETPRPAKTRERKGSKAKLDDVDEDVENGALPEDEEQDEDDSDEEEEGEEEDGNITETEADVDGHTELSISEDMEAITPSEGRSFASVDVVSSPRGSFSSDTALSYGINKRNISAVGAASRTKSHERDGSSAWLKHGSGRTIRNPTAPSLPLPSNSKTRSTTNSTKSTKNNTVSPVRVSKSANGGSASAVGVFESSSPNSPQEIEAALALCGLFASGRP